MHARSVRKWYCNNTSGIGRSKGRFAGTTKGDAKRQIHVHVAALVKLGSGPILDGSLRGGFRSVRYPRTIRFILAREVRGGRAVLPGLGGSQRLEILGVFQQFREPLGIAVSESLVSSRSGQPADGEYLVLLQRLDIVDAHAGNA